MRRRRAILLLRGFLPAIEIRPRRATELVDAGFQLLRRYYPQLFTVTAIAMAPSIFARVLMRDALSDPTVMMSHPVPALLDFVIATICTTIADVVLIVAVSDGYLDGKVDLAVALKSGMRGLLNVIGAGFVRYVCLTVVIAVMMIAAVLLTTVHLQLMLIVVIPAALWLSFYVLLRTFAVSQAVLLEGTGPFEALTRSLRLSEGCGAHIFFTLALVWVLFLITYLVALGASVALVSRSIMQIIGAVVVVAIYPLVAVVTTLLYYDLRVRKEGFDLEVMARELGTADGASGSAPLPAA